MIYRWNHGNGQAGPERTSRKAARADGVDIDGRTVGYLQFYAPGTADDPGDWFRCGVREESK